MLQYIDLYARHTPLPAEAALALREAMKTAGEEFGTFLAEQAERFYTEKEHFQDRLQEVEAAAPRFGIHPYTADALLILCCFRRMRQAYTKAGYSEGVYWDTAADLCWKLMECRNVYGVWGTFVGGWYPGFFLLKRFTLGRLQFEQISYDECDCVLHGVRLREGSTVINMHIPSSGPLRRQEVISSLQQAYRFFSCTGTAVMVCSSWLLYPAYMDVYPEGSRLMQFFRMFEIVHSDTEEEGHFSDAWRVFNRLWDGDPTSLPDGTTLQKNMKKHLAEGGKCGYGFGVILFDGEKPI